MTMAKKGVKFSKQHLANLRAAHAKRRGKKKITAESDYHDKLLDVVKYSPLPKVLMPLADRLKQAIDKIEEQIKRLENL